MSAVVLNVPVDGLELLFGLETIDPWALALLLASCLGLQAFLFYRAAVLGDLFLVNGPFLALGYVLVAGFWIAQRIDLHFHLGMVMLLLGVLRMVHVFRQGRVLHFVFESAFWLGVAVLINREAYAVWFALMLCLLYSRSFNWREWTVAVLGFVAPFYIWLLIHFLQTGLLASFWRWDGWGGWFTPDTWRDRMSLGFILLATVPGLYAYFKAYAEVVNRSRNTKNQFMFFAAVLVVSGITAAQGAFSEKAMYFQLLLALMLPAMVFAKGRFWRIVSTVLLCSTVCWWGIALLMS